MARLVGLAVVALFLYAWVRTLIAIIRTPDHMFRAGNQIVWVLVVLLAPLIGLVIYHAIGSPAAPGDRFR